MHKTYPIPELITLPPAAKTNNSVANSFDAFIHSRNRPEPPSDKTSNRIRASRQRQRFEVFTSALFYT